jgi:YbbR domain-containing protein
MSTIRVSAFSHVGLAVSFFPLFFLLASYNQNTESYHLHITSLNQSVTNAPICILSNARDYRTYDQNHSRSKSFLTL